VLKKPRSAKCSLENVKKKHFACSRLLVVGEGRKKEIERKPGRTISLVLSSSFFRAIFFFACPQLPQIWNRLKKLFCTYKFWKKE